MSIPRGALKRWMYRGGRPHRLAATLNRAWATLASAGFGPNRLVTLEVPGRRSGRTTSFPVVVAELEGRRYLVSMLGDNANWVQNVRASGGAVVLHHRRREAAQLEEVPTGDRPPVLRRYLEVAPGARPHVPVDRNAPLAEFERIAGDYPVFRIVAPG